MQPAVEPVSLADLKTRLRVTASQFDDELTDLIESARKQVEYDAHIKLITQTVVLTLDHFPYSPVLEIRQLPVQSITSVQYVDDNQTTQTLSSAKYTTDLQSKPCRVVLKETEDWEDTEPQYPQAVTVTFQAGYGDDAFATPVEARLAIVEWCRMHWGKCDGDATKYRNLVNTLAWSGAWKAV